MKSTIQILLLSLAISAFQSCTKSELESPESPAAEPSAIIVNPSDDSVPVSDAHKTGTLSDPSFSQVNDDDDDETGSPPKELK